jgi:CRP/FNR family transcriptional regulator, nitrogen fixation regulation protein
MTAAFNLDQAQSTAVALRTDALGDVMSQMGLRMTFARDEEIFGQDEEADLVYRVVEGAVRTTRLMSDGRRQIGDFYFEGELFGLEHGETHKFSAEALSDCTVQVLKRSALRKLSDTDPAIERMVWHATARELARAHEHVLLLGRKTACERVASLLQRVAERFGPDNAELPMGRQDMADYLGLTIETVSRMLSQLQQSAVIRFNGVRNFRIANQQALSRLAE